MVGALLGFVLCAVCGSDGIGQGVVSQQGEVKTFPHQGGWKHRWGKGTEDGQWEAK